MLCKKSQRKSLFNKNTKMHLSFNLDKLENMYEIVNKNIPVLEINFQKLIDYWSMEVNNIVITGHASECNVSDDEYSSDNTHFCSKLKYSKFNLQIFLDQGPGIPLLSSASVKWRNRISLEGVEYDERSALYIYSP